MRVTIKDIARLANVSVGTASLAMNDKPTVNAETKRHVQEIARKYNYTPNHSARSLITKKSSSIGLVVTDISNPFFAALVDEFSKLLDKRGYTMLLGISGDRIKSEQKYIDMFISKNVEGVIIIPTIEQRPDLKHLYELKNLDLPFVFCTSSYNGFVEPCIMTDLKLGEHLLVKHLLSHGMKKIYFITGSHELQLSRLRLEGYYQAYREAGLTYQSNWIIETIPDFAHGYQEALNCIQDKPDAIVTVNDYLAMGVIKALRDKNIQIPKEISVAGYDDLLFASIIETPLTTVRQPISDICTKTLEILFQRMEGKKSKENLYYLQPELIIRESTA